MVGPGFNNFGPGEECGLRCNKVGWGGFWGNIKKGPFGFSFQNHKDHICNLPKVRG